MKITSQKKTYLVHCDVLVTIFIPAGEISKGPKRLAINLKKQKDQPSRIFFLFAIDYLDLSFYGTRTGRRENRWKRVHLLKIVAAVFPTKNFKIHFLGAPVKVLNSVFSFNESASVKDACVSSINSIIPFCEIHCRIWYFSICILSSVNLHRGVWEKHSIIDVLIFFPNGF